MKNYEQQSVNSKPSQVGYDTAPLVQPDSILSSEIRHSYNLITEQRDMLFRLCGLADKMHIDEMFNKQISEILSGKLEAKSNDNNRTSLLLDYARNNGNLYENNEMLRIIVNKLTELI